MSDDTPPAWAQAMEARLLGHVGELRGSVGELRDHVGELRGSLGELRSHVDGQLAATRGAIMARIDRLQDTLTEVKAESVVPMGTAEMALAKVENTRSDVQTLTEMVLAMNRVLRGVQAELRQLRGEE